MTYFLRRGVHDAPGNDQGSRGRGPYPVPGGRPPSRHQGRFDAWSLSCVRTGATMLNRMKYIIPCAVMIILSYGCGLSPIVNIGQYATTGSGNAEDFLPGLENRPDIINLAVSAGESLGYKVHVRNEGVVVLIHQYTQTQKVLSGNSVITSITVSRSYPHSKAMGKSLGVPGGLPKGYEQNSDKSFPGLFLACSVHGSFGAGTDQSAAQKLEEFKRALLSLTK